MSRKYLISFTVKAVSKQHHFYLYYFPAIFIVAVGVYFFSWDNRKEEVEEEIVYLWFLKEVKLLLIAKVFRDQRSFVARWSAESQKLPLPHENFCGSMKKINTSGFWMSTVDVQPDSPKFMWCQKKLYFQNCFWCFSAKSQRSLLPKTLQSSWELTQDLPNWMDIFRDSKDRGKHCVA